MTNHEPGEARFTLSHSSRAHTRMQVIDPAHRIVRLGHDNLPLEAQFHVAGSVWDLRSNSEEILRAMGETFDRVESEQQKADLHLRFYVDFTLRDAPPLDAAAL